MQRTGIHRLQKRNIVNSDRTFFNFQGERQQNHPNNIIEKGKKEHNSDIFPAWPQKELNDFSLMSHPILVQIDKELH